ncbi:MAG: (deoxy)nucleoside triphosphate pyrophosphohydrolase [Tepidisphaeraceae bacterium]
MDRDPTPPAFAPPATVVAVAIGIVIERGRLLICQRKATAVLGGLWEFPGGKVEPGESDADAAIRELREELGIVVRPIEHLAPITHTYPHATIRLQPILCRLVDGSPRAIECVDFRWVAPEALRDYTFPEANGPLLAIVAAHPRVLTDC